MAKLTGVIVVKVDGGSLRSKEGATLGFGGTERTPQYADGVLVGFTNKPLGATGSFTIAHGADTDVETLRNAENSTLIFECDSGVNYLINGAFLTVPPELTGGEGDMTLEFMGQPATPV